MTFIRSATASDLAAIGSIYADEVNHGTATFDLQPPSLSQWQSKFESITQQGYPFYVAANDDVVVGYSYASAFRDRPAYRHTVETSIYIAPSAQGQGVGFLLMQQVLADLVRQEFKLALAVIGGSDNLGSIALHQKLGFDHAGLLPKAGYKFERWVDVVLMSKELR
ncbi:MAG: N-acetyltransferase family protein [Gammaproteobacteria bacterium]|nr:N-acetyltransferase family protein [Gammaproteobacteria bacterium]